MNLSFLRQVGLILCLQVNLLLAEPPPTAIPPAIPPDTLAKLKQADPATRAQAVTLLTTSLETLQKADAALAQSETQTLHLPQRSQDPQLTQQTQALINATSQKRWAIQQQILQLKNTLAQLQAPTSAKPPIK